MKLKGVNMDIIVTLTTKALRRVRTYGDQVGSIVKVNIKVMVNY